MNHTAEKSQFFRCAIAIIPDIVLADPGVERKKAFHAAWLGKNISGVAELWGLHHNRLLKVENIFGPERIYLPGAARELAIEERVVVGTPADLCDVEVSRNTKIRANLFELRFFDSAVFESRAHLIQRPRVLAEAMICAASCLHLLLEVTGESDAQPTGQSSLPFHELPLAAALAIFAALHEGCVDLELDTRKMLPLVPGGIPNRVQGGRIQPELKLSAYVTAHCRIVVEITFPQRNMKPALPAIRHEPENPTGKEGASIARGRTLDQKRTKAAVGKGSRCLWIGQEPVVAGT